MAVDWCKLTESVQRSYGKLLEEVGTTMLQGLALLLKSPLRTKIPTPGMRWAMERLFSFLWEKSMLLSLGFTEQNLDRPPSSKSPA